MTSKRHKVFVSYHHALDQGYRDTFEKLFANTYEILLSRSVNIGDIPDNTPTDKIRQKIRDEYLRDSTVTIVLIGQDTWKRKHVDWEIGSSIRETKYNARSGLLGIILPSYERSDNSKYSPYTIPPRLYKNIQNGFASIHNWSNDPELVRQRIHEAFIRRNEITPDNSYDNFSRNRSDSDLRWYD